MKELQQQVKSFCDAHDMNAPIEYRMLDVISEMGELAKEVLKMSEYGKQPISFREEVKGELGDVFYSLLTVANTLDVDLKEALAIVLEKYEKRLAKGSAGSEND